MICITLHVLDTRLKNDDTHVTNINEVDVTYIQGRDFSVFERKSVFGIACELEMCRKK